MAFTDLAEHIQETFGGVEPWTYFEARQALILAFREKENNRRDDVAYRQSKRYKDRKKILNQLQYIKTKKKRRLNGLARQISIIAAAVERYAVEAHAPRASYCQTRGST